MHSTERKTHVLHPPAEPLNIKSEIFSDFVSLESSKDFNSLPAPTLLPSPPLSSHSSAGDELEFDASIAGLNINGLAKKSRSGELSPAVQQARCWSAALMAKKAAMENLLKVQKSLEEVENSIMNHLSKESVESAHARFLSTLNPSHPDGYYLLTIGQAVVCPLSVRLEGRHASSVGMSL
ncbi:hypothetical protein SCLCIDRAFT_29840 [Scleroderma citrinum Foug A]|uniref:Uncharacterized protein n=1 Tax=Scleroderma citrinum Foug A TaxID=1036808 RepID=A0A0C3DJB3_9AGAM|nr:hypothetical protein SCLCIDRAFT_29840 [Scleroderma citrinum Foug A]